MELEQQVEVPVELAALTKRRPQDLAEFRDWCDECYRLVVELEPVDAELVGPNALHRTFATLVRKAIPYVRKFVDPKKADQMPWVDSKCASFTLIRFEECLEWCKDQIGEQPGAGPDGRDSVLSPDVEAAYRMSVLAEQSLVDVRQRERDRPRDNEVAIAEVLNGNKEPRRPTDKAIYRHLRTGFAKANGYDLPLETTWARYVRRGRRYYGTSKNNSRADRTGGSIKNRKQL